MSYKLFARPNYCLQFLTSFGKNNPLLKGAQNARLEVGLEGEKSENKIDISINRQLLFFI